eukprot:SAG31_NODE_5621_length_2419_cov_4.649138_1_plen_158_part_00
MAFDEADVDAIFSVNMKGTLNVCGAAGKAMKEQAAGGSIVLISALGGGLVGLGRAGSAYGMSKGGIVSLARDLAAEWAGSIRVNAVAPGWIRTPLTQALQDHPTRGKAVLQRVPSRRWGDPADVAAAVLLLASEASAYITGHTVPVDGGAANVISLE